MPLIHILHDQLNELVHTLMKQMKQERTSKKLLAVDVCKSENQLLEKMLMVISEST